jgi:signal transduction histidine kinase
MACIALLQPLTEYLGTHDFPRFLAKILVVAVGTPLVLLLGSTVFRRAIRWRGGALLLVLVGLAASGLLYAALLFGVRALSFEVEALKPHVGLWGPADVLRIGFTMGLTTFALWTLALVFPLAVADARIRALELEKLRAETEKLRAETELAQIRAQFAPHFLLNSLSAVAGLVTDDPREAQGLLAALGDLLRESLRSDGEMQALGQQLEWLRSYAQILQARHAGLTFRWEVEDQTRRAVIPRWILQPLVENAVKHGALKQLDGGSVTVGARLVGDKLVCTIQDNGPGMADATTRSGGVGLALVRRRLALKYADGASLRLESSGPGTRSILELPYAE